MTTDALRSRVARLAALVAIVFGFASIAAGASVLGGRDPGYLVYRPLLVFNTVMGLAYVATGLLAWRRAPAARNVAAGIVAVNLLVLAFIAYRYRSNGGAAIDSVRAMVFRTGVWLLLMLAFTWAGRAADESGKRSP